MRIGIRAYRRIFCLLPAVVCLALACGSAPSSKKSSPPPTAQQDTCSETTSKDAHVAVPTAEAGFLEVPPGPSGPAFVNRMFYSFQPASTDAANAPVLVLFNGGPGYATSAGLLLFGTGPYTLDPMALATGVPAQNPASLTRFANLLYLDSPQAGFSYGVRNDIDCSCRGSSPDYVWDAADFVKALLTFLDDHKALRDNPVVLVGESYGGVRAAAMLYLLQHYADPDGAIEDFEPEGEALRDRIREHFTLAFSERCRPETPEEVAAQFGWQALIQPHIFGERENELRDILLFEDPRFARYARCLRASVAPPPAPISAEVKIIPPDSYTQLTALPDVCEQMDPDDIRQTAGEGALMDQQSLSVVTDPAALSLLLGLPLDEVPLLSASERSDSFRFCCNETSSRDMIPEDVDLAAALGSVSACDTYWLQSFRPCGERDDLYGAGVGSGRAFFDALLRTSTFITHARYDVVAYSGALVSLLGDSATYGTVPWKVTLDETMPDDAARPGVIHLDGAGIDKTIRFPPYAAGHAVTVTQAAAFGEDLEAWLTETGALAP